MMPMRIASPREDRRTTRRFILLRRLGGRWKWMCFAEIHEVVDNYASLCYVCAS